MTRHIASLIAILFINVGGYSQSEHSVARKWNEVLLEGIRNDLARPTIHARNLFHISAAMYDAWAAYSNEVQTYFLGNEIGGYFIPFERINVSSVSDQKASQEEAISYAVYRLMEHRYRNSPGFSETRALMDQLMNDLGYDINFFDTDYSTGSPAALGNYIADRVKTFGFQDGANELGDYENRYYEPVNDPLPLVSGGDNDLVYPNRWQPLEFDESFIDQSGNVIQKGLIPFLSPEWGDVIPFALEETDINIYTRDGNDYHVFADPGAPAYIDTVSGSGIEDPYKWAFALVATWSSHLDPTDGVIIDVSPASIGNIDPEDYPHAYSAYDQFYDILNGGDISSGYDLNPITGSPYEEQLVPRGDYARVLAEFWADGPDSETPPGHWFTILNYVSDHAAFVKRYKGEGEVLDNLEWDVKSYFMLGGAMHDVAIASWSVKGFYDYIRPISAIRYMATRGQSTDESKPNYDMAGIPLIPGFIELIEPDDPLAGPNDEFVDEVKLFAWKGHDFIDDASTDTAGVGWILAKEWWPYQRPSFVTPPFAGYVSGHSTFSRAAAEVLTLLTGDEYFPGGMGEFHAPQNDFLVFEQGPSVDVDLQWAKYYDASDQCSLSRIWGGIHPPIDDIPGRIMGMKIGKQAFSFAEAYFSGKTLGTNSVMDRNILLFPNPTSGELHFKGIKYGESIRISNLLGQEIMHQIYNGNPLALDQFKEGLYLISVGGFTQKLMIDR